MGVEKYYGFSVMIPEETVKNDGQRTRFDEDYWVIIAQWHGDDGKAPPLAVRYHKDVEGDKAEIFITGSQDRVDLGLIKSFVVDKGEWFDLVFHVVWDLGNKGYLRVWLDGEKIVDVYDQTVNSATVRGFKSHTTNVRFGGYRGNYISGAQVFYHDEYRAGNSYANVAPPGSPPVNDEPAPPPECNLIGSCTTSGGCPGTYDSSCVCVDVAGDNCPLSCSVGGSCTTGQNCAGTFNANCICQDNSGDNCPVIIPEDLNNDERVDIADLILLIRAFGSSQHDLTGDNKVDVQDLLVIIKKL